MHTCTFNWSWHKTKIFEISSTHPKTAMEADIKQSLHKTKVYINLIKAPYDCNGKQSGYEFN